MHKKSFYIKTLGCKVNQYESQVIRENFLREGYIEAPSVDEADICVVNTCTVTSTSDSKSLKLIRNSLKKYKPVIATGCMVEDKDLDLSRLAGVKFIIKNKDKYKIPEIVAEAAHSAPAFAKASSFALRASEDRSADKNRIAHSITGLKGHTRIFVKIQDGCDNVCSYCKVRIVRGRSRSRPFIDIIDECKNLIATGAKEIVLSGICLGAYGRDLSKDFSLCRLIEELCKIEGGWRLRLSSIEPKDINDELVYQLQTQDRLCKHLHIPFQSGDNHILKKMNRPYKRSEYLNIVGRLRKTIPDVAISSDMMVGFPGETDKRFLNTLKFIKDVRPMRMHVFPFSKREGTRAYTFIDDIKPAIKKEREEILLNLGRDLARGFVNKFANKSVEVLVEDKKTDKGYLQGYSDRYIKVYIDGPDILKGHLVNCRLTLTNCNPYGILLPYFF